MPNATPQRVAVVFVHGQGDQRPMKDVLELANAVWETDSRASLGDQLAPIWSVPTVEADDLPDQRRLVSDSNSGVQVDFYQYYWSHLMRGNRFIHLWLWLLELFSKKPGEVPQRLRGVRALGMRFAHVPIILALLFCVVSVLHLIVLNYQNEILQRLRREVFIGGDGDPRSFMAPSFFDIWWVTWEAFFAVGFLIALGWFFIVVRGLERSRRKQAFYWSMIVLSAGLLFWLGAHWHPNYLANPSEALRYFARDDGALTFPSSDNRQWVLGWDRWPWLTTYNALIAIFTIVLVTAIVTGALFAWSSYSFLTPVMADSARYFRPAPENISARHDIRSTGVQLLERLHESKRNYDRIIVVGHSLGSVVAYGMLEQLWGKRSGGKAICSAADTRAMRKLERAARGLEDLPHDHARMSRFRDAQRRLFRKIVGARGDKTTDWRISDFVTLGSPLNYGPFLMAESASEFNAQVRKHRRLSVAPPDGSWIDGRWSFCYSSATGAGPHHAAMFAAVRWTNIYFKTSGLVRGDIVGGPIAPVFGPGVLDVECDPADTKKTFAHNEYWRWPHANEVDQWYGGQERAFEQPPRYLRALRCSLNLFDYAAVEDILQKMSWGED